ncbi:unnamed protein product, partial [Sphagnum troendelagicum]
HMTPISINNLIAHWNLLVMLFSFGFWLVMVLILGYLNNDELLKTLGKHKKERRKVDVIGS